MLNAMEDSHTAETAKLMLDMGMYLPSPPYI